MEINMDEIKHKLSALEKMASKNPGHVNEQFATSDSVAKGIAIEFIDVDHSAHISKDLKKLLEKLDEFDGLKLYPYQYEMINLLSDFNTEKSLQELSDLATDPDDFSSDIPSLKKRIKYCKNPLERKSLERQLNAAYKEMKKRRC